MLNQIKIQGLKCFQDVKVDFSNFTLLAGKNSTGKSTVIQAILALYQNSDHSLAGSYMNIGSVSEVKNKICGSKEIILKAEYEQGEETFWYEKCFTDDRTESKRGTRFPDEIQLCYLTADRIGVEDTYKKSFDREDRIGVRCEFAFYYLAKHKDERMKEGRFIFDPKTKLTLGGQVDYWLERILGYRVTAEEISGTELIRVAYTNKEIGKNIRPKNVGTGVSYIAEIIIAALSCKRGDMLIIEKPEIQLQPSGQAELIRILIIRAREEQEVVMHMHSDDI